MLGVSKSGYYKWLKQKDREPTKSERYREEVKQKIRQFFHESMGTYGAPRILKDLIEAGYSVSEKTVGRYHVYLDPGRMALFSYDLRLILSFSRRLVYR